MDWLNNVYSVKPLSTMRMAQQCLSDYFITTMRMAQQYRSDNFISTMRSLLSEICDDVVVVIIDSIFE